MQILVVKAGEAESVVQLFDVFSGRLVLTRSLPDAITHAEILRFGHSSHTVALLASIAPPFKATASLHIFPSNEYFRTELMFWAADPVTGAPAS